MGWFGSSSSNNKSNNPDGDAIYVDMEANDGLPVAVAVPENSSSHNITPSAPPGAPSPTYSSSAMLDTSTQQQTQQGKHVEPMSKEQALQHARQNRTATTTTTTTATMTTTYFVSRTPTVIPCCPNCNQRNVRTRIRTAPDLWTWVAAIALFLIFWPVCWIPLVTDSCRCTHHYCGRCGAELGRIASFQDCCVKHR